MAEMEMPKFTDKLYSEGLVMRYSEKPYDNLAIKRKNYEELYLTDTITRPWLVDYVKNLELDYSIYDRRRKK